MLHWPQVERELLSLQLDPRRTPARRILAVVWTSIIGEAEWWQIEMLLADCATEVEEHTNAVARLEALVDSKRFPAEQRQSITRALFYARRREAGQEVPSD